MLVAFLALLAFLGGFGGKSAKNVECAKEGKDRIRRIYVYFVILLNVKNEFMEESQNIEFKESWRDEYLKWICGFANADGGRIYIGITDNNEIIGVEKADKLMEDIPNKVRDILGIVVDVNLLTEGDKKYIEIVVEPYMNPINYKGVYHYRSGSTKLELTGPALNKFLLDKVGLKWCDVIVPGASVEELDHNMLKLYREKAIKSNRIDEDVLNDTDHELLEELKLLENDKLTRAAVLLFHPKQEKYFFGSYIKIAFFTSDDEIIFQDEVHGSLMEQIDKAYELIRSKYMAYAISYDGKQRVERPPYHPKALRESLLNAVAHKDYSTQVPIQVSVYKDHIVFWNSGELPNGWDIKRLVSKHPSLPFNPLIANALFRCGEIETWGRGIKKIINYSLEHGLLPPVFDTSYGGLMITFYNSPVTQIINDGYDQRDADIIEFVLANGKVTNADVQRIANVSKPTATRLLNGLSQYLISNGSRGKGAYYTLNTELIGSK